MVISWPFYCICTAARSLRLPFWITSYVYGVSTRRVSKLLRRRVPENGNYTVKNAVRANSWTTIVGQTWKHRSRTDMHRSCMFRHTWTASCIHDFSGRWPTSREIVYAWKVCTWIGPFYKIWPTDQKEKRYGLLFFIPPRILGWQALWKN